MSSLLPPEHDREHHREHHRQLQNSLPRGFVRKSGDGWVNCGCGNRHWGLFGAAGLFLAKRGADGRWSHVVLQHRALWSHQGGTWGVPGGALMEGETPVEAALREAHEEAGVSSTSVIPLASHEFTHPDWSYTTIVAESAGPLHTIGATDSESLEIEWVELPLLRLAAASDDRQITRNGEVVEFLPAFRSSLPRLLQLLDEQE